MAGLPSSPNPPIEVDRRTDRPQPRLDLDRGGGMAVTVGRVRSCPILDLRLRCPGPQYHPRRRGPAVQIAELLVAEESAQRRYCAGMIVAKFGGTSVADAAAIGRSIEIVRSRSGDQPIVVVSALARVTDAPSWPRPSVRLGRWRRNRSCARRAAGAARVHRSGAARRLGGGGCNRGRCRGAPDAR